MTNPYFLLPAPVEHALFKYHLPQHQIEIKKEIPNQEYVAALEADPPNECPNCNAVIGDHDSFCSEECERQFNGADELISRPDFVLDEDEDGDPGERLARDGYCELDEDRLRDQEQDR